MFDGNIRNMSKHKKTNKKLSGLQRLSGLKLFWEQRIMLNISETNRFRTIVIWR